MLGKNFKKERKILVFLKKFLPFLPFEINIGKLENVRVMLFLYLKGKFFMLFFPFSFSWGKFITMRCFLKEKFFFVWKMWMRFFLAYFWYLKHFVCLSVLHSYFSIFRCYWRGKRLLYMRKLNIKSVRKVRKKWERTERSKNNVRKVK